MLARALVLSALSFLPVTLCAQDDSAFHAGQWALQFGGGANLFSLGALKFTSPRSATLVDVDLYAVIVNGHRTDFSGTAESDDKVTQLNVRLGKRSYRAPHGKIVSFHSLAIEGGYYGRLLDFQFGRARIRQWNAGLYWEVGAAYRVTPSLSLGGSASVSAGYLYQRQENTGTTTKGGGYYFQGIHPVFAVAIYF
jgi:hypothetical protein